LKLGKSIDIIVIRGDYKFRLVSKLEDVQEKRVCVTLIEAKNRTFHFYETDEISFLYRNEDRLWIWNKVKAGETMLDGYRVHYFETSQKGESYNRRNAYRLFIGEDIKLFYPESTKNKTVAEADKEAEEEEQYLECNGFLKDLSENGAGIFSDERFALKNNITFYLDTEFGKLKCTGEVVRIVEETHGIYRKYYGCSLIQSERNLSRYLFKLQKLQIQKARQNLDR
jgi:PilZ domain.